MNLETEYKEYVIRYQTHFDKWEICGFEDQFDTLSLAKIFIDKLSKIKYKEEIVFVFENSSNFPFLEDLPKVTATRPHKTKWVFSNPAFWVKTEKGKRETVTCPLYLDIPENHNLFSKIRKVEEKLRELEVERGNLIGKLTALQSLEIIE